MYPVVEREEDLILHPQNNNSLTVRNLLNLRILRLGNWLSLSILTVRDLLSMSIMTVRKISGKIQTREQLKEHLFNLRHNLRIFGVSPFVKRQNKSTTFKLWKVTYLLVAMVSLYLMYSFIHGMIMRVGNLPSMKIVRVRNLPARGLWE